MLSAAYDGVDTDVQPSWRYLLHLWRKEMRVSYQAMRETPIDVIKADLEYISIARTIRAAKQENHSA